MKNRYYFSEDNRESLPDAMEKTFSENQLKEVYRDIIDKTEYHDFQEWFLFIISTLYPFFMYIFLFSSSFAPAHQYRTFTDRLKTSYSTACTLRFIPFFHLLIFRL